MVSMKKLLLAVLAVAAVAIVAVAVVVVVNDNTPERRMDRRIDKLLRTYDDPKQLFQRAVDDRDPVGSLVRLFLVRAFLLGLGHCSCEPTGRGHKEDCELEVYAKKLSRMESRFAMPYCDCGVLKRLFSNSRLICGVHPDSCPYERAMHNIREHWDPYLERKTRELHALAKEQLTR